MFILCYLLSLLVDYAKMLEKESRDLKLKIRKLEEKLESTKLQEESHTIPPKGVPFSDGVVPAGVNNAYLKSHIQSLHDTIGKWYCLFQIGQLQSYQT